MRHDLEIARLNEAAQQIAAGRAVVQVVDRRSDVPDVHVHGIADHHHLEARERQHDCTHPRIPEDLDELLDQHVMDAFEHQVSFFLNFRLATATITTQKTTKSAVSPARISSPTPLR